MKKYIFPLNFDYSNKLLGFIEYKVLLYMSVCAALLILILYPLSFSTFAKFCIFITVFFPILLLVNTNINHIPFYILVYSIVKHSLTSGKYLKK